MFVETDRDYINLNSCRQIEIIESFGKSAIYLRSSIVSGNERIKSTFTIGGFETYEDAQDCRDSILNAYEVGEKVWRKPTNENEDELDIGGNENVSSE
ncbi:MAG: hypothetical protein OXM61_17225 [Candidatus Poribacteria bacterium]|nr:hypothetical protein [Candidatus Poribacteria bacterium]